jgi:hypothetical protein
LVEPLKGLGAPALAGAVLVPPLPSPDRASAEAKGVGEDIVEERTTQAAHGAKPGLTLVLVALIALNRHFCFLYPAIQHGRHYLVLIYFFLKSLLFLLTRS